MLRIPGPGKSLRQRSAISSPFLAPGNGKRVYGGRSSYSIFNVRNFGARGDYGAVGDAAMGSGSTTLTSVANPFTPDRVGQYIAVQGAGAAGVNLFTTIATYVSPGQVTLTDANASGGAISGKFSEFGTDDTVAFQRTIAAAEAAGGGQVYFLGNFLVSQLDLAAINLSVELVGEGVNTSRIFPMHISAYTGATGHVLDLTGSSFVKLRRFQLGAYYSLPKPKTGIFLGQIASGVSNRVEFDELYITGQYAVSTFYNYGVPSSIARGCDFYNYVTGAGAHNCMTLTADNSGSLSSSYATVTSGDSSTSDWLFDACEFHKFAGAGANNDVITLDQVTNVIFQSGAISGGASRYVTFQEACTHVSFDCVTMETESEPVTPTNAIYLDTGCTLNGLGWSQTSYVIGAFATFIAGAGSLQSVKGGTMYMANSAGNLTAGATNYIGAGSTTTGAAADVLSLLSENVLICGMQAFQNAAPGLGKTYAYTVQIAGADVALTCSVTGAGGTSASDTTHYAVGAIGQGIDIKAVVTAAATAARSMVTVTMLPIG